MKNEQEIRQELGRRIASAITMWDGKNPYTRRSLEDEVAATIELYMHPEYGEEYEGEAKERGWVTLRFEEVSA